MFESNLQAVPKAEKLTTRAMQSARQSIWCLRRLLPLPALETASNSRTSGSSDPPMVGRYFAATPILATVSPFVIEGTARMNKTTPLAGARASKMVFPT